MSTGSQKIKLKMPSPYGLIPIFALLMDVLLIYAFLIALTYWQQLGWDTPPLNFISLLILTAGTFTVTRLFMTSPWSLKWVRLGTVGLALTLLLVLLRVNLSGGYAFLDFAWIVYAGNSIPAVVIGLAAGIYLIWRGLTVNRQSAKFDSLYRQFTLGLSALILILVISGIAKLDSRVVWSAVGLCAFGFFGFGLFALAMGNLESLQDKLLHHQEAVRTFRRRWLSMLVLLVAAILVAAVVLSSLFNSNLAAALLRGLSTAGGWLWDNIIYLFYPIGFIAQVLFYVFAFFFNLLRRNEPVTPPPLNMGDWKQQLENPSTAPPDYLIIIVTVLKWLVVAAAAGLIIYLLARSLRRSHQGKNEEGLEEVNESLWSWPTFKADLRSFWSWLFGWIGKRRSQSALYTYTETPVVRNRTVDDRIYNVRELYRAVLWQGRELGIPRRIEETPDEYCHRLEIRAGEASQEIEQLTEAYIQERYGQTNTEPEKLKWLNQLWRSLRNKFSPK